MANESKPFWQVCTLQWGYIFIVDKRRLQKSQKNCFFKQMVSKTHCQSFIALDQFILSALLEFLPCFYISIEYINHHPESIFFSIWFVLSISHLRFTGQQGKGQDIFNSSLPLQPASLTPRHQPEDYGREIISVMTGLELGTFCLREHVSGKKSLTTKLRACQVTRNLMIVRSFLPSLIICRSLGLSLVTKINYQSKGNVGIHGN